MYAFQCPNCKIPYGNLTKEQVFAMGGGEKCTHCGVKFRVCWRHEETICDTCGHVHECEETIEKVYTEPWCNEKYSPHHWQPTLATDMEKCMKCFLILKK